MEKWQRKCVFLYIAFFFRDSRGRPGPKQKCISSKSVTSSDCLEEAPTEKPFGGIRDRKQKKKGSWTLATTLRSWSKMTAHILGELRESVTHPLRRGEDGTSVQARAKTKTENEEIILRFVSTLSLSLLTTV